MNNKPFSTSIDESRVRSLAMMLADATQQLNATLALNEVLSQRNDELTYDSNVNLQDTMYAAETLDTCTEMRKTEKIKSDKQIANLKFQLDIAGNFREPMEDEIRELRTERDSLSKSISEHLATGEEFKNGFCLISQEMEMVKYMARYFGNSHKKVVSYCIEKTYGDLRDSLKSNKGERNE